MTWNKRQKLLPLFGGTEGRWWIDTRYTAKLKEVWRNETPEKKKKKKKKERKERGKRERRKRKRKRK
ncbi:hypothetical protein PUN28_002896 [Cardiocondyla obscurior]|uniref:Uncharacterized protein n=1 Tax=Cardiocondyla obscurior TaxID=286306 RepID=A0AAW2GWT7_9HYME